jgi:hypothetical protein
MIGSFYGRCGMERVGEEGGQWERFNKSAGEEGQTSLKPGDLRFHLELGSWSEVCSAIAGSLAPPGAWKFERGDI